MSDQQKKMVPINYTNREFQGIRDDLLEIAQKYYPDSFQDFSEGSFGSLMLDAVAYVGDQLSFYLDYNVNESFLDTAYQYDNIIRHGKVLGYKQQGRPSTYGQAAFFILVPASSTALGPDNDYIPILRRGAQVSTSSGLSFVLTENVNFADTRNPRVVARVNDTTGAPTFYAIKAYGNVVSGRFGVSTISVGPHQRFRRVTLPDPNITEVISVTDSEGNEYYEVQYLSQDIVYQELSNKNFRNDNVPSIMKPLLVSRKFVVDRDSNFVYLQFGSGKDGASEVVADFQSVAIDVFGKKYTSDTTFDPSKLSENENFGVVPSNTELRIVYRITNSTNSNVSVGSLSSVSSFKLDFEDRIGLNNASILTIENSLEVINETPIVGDVSYASNFEIKQRVYDTFPTQNRAVTQTDYENLAYRMPPKFGSIKRCSTQKDPNSLKRNLNMYVISEDSEGSLTETNATIKNNLKTWLDNYRMINDTIDILDPYIINIGVEFLIRANINVNKNNVLQAAISELTTVYEEGGFYIGEPLNIADIYATLKNVPGVLDVISVKIINKTGANYSSVYLDINKNMSPHGDQLVTPANAILELKYPAVDIKGKIR